MPLDNEILGYGVYTPREAARLVGESPQQVLRWTRGVGPSEPLWNARYRFIEDSAEVSFIDLIELRVVSAMRKNGISLQSIRFAISFAQEALRIERPLSSRNFKTDGAEVLMEAMENDGEHISLSSHRPGQKVFTEIIRQSLNDLEYDGDLVARWRPKNFADVVLDPQRSFGGPVLDAYGISTATLLAEFEQFEDLKYLSQMYEIPIQSIKSGISFEKHLDSAAKRSDGRSST